MDATPSNKQKPIKNIIFDIGGIFCDDSKANTESLFDKPCDHIIKSVYNQDFDDRILGNLTLDEQLAHVSGCDDFEDVEFLLDPKNLDRTYPLIKTNYDKIKILPSEGYVLYLLSNATKEGFEYFSQIVDIDKYFAGGVYSYQEHVKKPDPKIYEIIVERYGLDKAETIFFDDRQKNVDAANECGIKSYLFKSMDEALDIIRR